MNVSIPKEQARLPDLVAHLKRQRKPNGDAYGYVAKFIVGDYFGLRASACLAPPWGRCERSKNDFEFWVTQWAGILGRNIGDSGSLDYDTIVKGFSGDKSIYAKAEIRQAFNKCIEIIKQSGKLEELAWLLMKGKRIDNYDKSNESQTQTTNHKPQTSMLSKSAKRILDRAKQTNLAALKQLTDERKAIVARHQSELAEIDAAMTALGGSYSGNGLRASGGTEVGNGRTAKAGRKPAKSSGELEDLITKALSGAEGKQLAGDALKEAVKSLRGKDARSPKDDAMTRAKKKLGEKVLVKNGVWKLK
jgi:ribosomal protein L22